MRKIIFVLLISVYVLCFFGCESLPKKDSAAITDKTEVSDTTPSTPPPDSAEEIQQEAQLEIQERSHEPEVLPPSEPEVPPEPAVPQENIDFIANMAVTSIQVISKPSTTTKNRAFNAPYVISVTQNGAPAADMPVTISFPSSRDNDEISYATEQRVTGKDGRISFTPQAPSCSADDTITFYPTPINDDTDVTEAAKKVSATSQWRVRTNYISRQGMIYVFDHDTRGRAGNNSFAMLQAFRNLGFNIGNAPISDASYLTRSVDSLYRTTKSMVGDTFGMLFSGSVKYVEPPKSVEGGFECSLAADITCINMSNGSILYQTTRTKSAVAKTEYDALIKCREALASEMAQAVLYGM